jgi:alpha-L-rhamnosidase
MSPRLQVEQRAAQRVVRSRLVQSPELLVHGAPGQAEAGPALLRCDLGAAELVLDFGTEVVGFVEVDAAADAAVPLLIRYGERESELTADTALELPWYRFPRDEMSAGPGAVLLRSRGRRAFRWLSVCAPRAAAPVSLASVTVFHQHASVARHGAFRSSDPVLNGAWDISCTTTELCMQGYLEDGIKRDGLLWIGDARVQALCAYHAFGDTAVTERSLRMIAASQREDGALPSCAAVGGGHQHPEVIEYMPNVTDGVGRWIIDNYVADFLSALHEHYRHTGDAALLRELWPCAQRAAAWLAAVPLSPPVEKNIITDENPRQKDSWWASPGTFLLQMRGAFRDLASCAAVLRDETVSGFCRQTMARVDAIVAASYRQSDGTITDRPATAGAAPEVSWHANAFAVLSGLEGDRADGTRSAADLLRQVAAVPDAAPPIAGFMKYWVLEALMTAGLKARAVDDARAWWGFMLAHGATTCWEKLDLRAPGNVLDSPLVSRCHGWSAGPCVLFPRHLLGLAPARPGWASVTVRPFLPPGVDWMEGTVPTPRGACFARWEQTDEGMTGCVVLPAGVDGSLVVPGAPPRVLGSGSTEVAVGGRGA